MGLSGPLESGLRDEDEEEEAIVYGSRLEGEGEVSGRGRGVCPIYKRDYNMGGREKKLNNIMPLHSIN